MACVQKIFSVWVVLAIFLSATANAFSFDYKKSFQGPNDSPVASSGSGQVKVRFVNTKSGQDVVIGANVGENLLQVADKAGVHVPRSCRSDTCGTCTVDMQDPGAAQYTDTAGMTNRAGYQTIRACVSKVVPPPGGMGELVVDVFRSNLLDKGPSADGKAPSASSNPMERFSLDWELNYTGVHGESPGSKLKRALDKDGGMLALSLAHALEITGRNSDSLTPRTRRPIIEGELPSTLAGGVEGPSPSSTSSSGLQPMRNPLKKRFSRKDWKN